jgi:hypothetical protein
MMNRFNCPDCTDQVLTLDEEAETHTCAECELTMTVEAAEDKFAEGDLVMATPVSDGDEPAIEEDTEFNGFENQQTWAANLLIQNSYKLFKEANKAIAESADDEGATDLKAFVESNKSFTDLDLEVINYDELMEEMVDGNDEMEDVTADLVTALGASDDLTEEQSGEITQVFETALQVAVNRMRLRIEEQTAERFDVELAEAVEELNTQADSYLTSVAEEWYEENRIAIESGLKVEKTERFLEGLHLLFKENFIEVPEERFDVLADLAQKVADLEEAVDTAKGETKIAEAKLVEDHKKLSVAKLAEGLADSDVERLEEISESVDYESEEQFETALGKLKESLIDSKNSDAGKTTITEDGENSDDNDEDPARLATSDDPMIAAAARMLRVQ